MFCGLIPAPSRCWARRCAACCSGQPAAGLVHHALHQPFTIVPLYLAAFTIGEWILGGGGHFTAPPNGPGSWSGAGLLGWLEALAQWMLGLGRPLALGLITLPRAPSATATCWFGWSGACISCAPGGDARTADRDKDRLRPGLLRRLLHLHRRKAAHLPLPAQPAAAHPAPHLLSAACCLRWWWSAPWVSTSSAAGGPTSSDAFYMTLITVTTVGYGEDRADPQALANGWLPA